MRGSDKLRFASGVLDLVRADLGQETLLRVEKKRRLAHQGQ